MVGCPDKLAKRIVRAKLARADTLAVFPTAAVRILQVVDDPRTNLVDMERAVALDPVLTGQVLKLANSAYFGLTRTIDDLRQALFVLGFAATRNLALSLAALSLGDSERPWRRRIWNHSLTSCKAMALLRQRVAWKDRADPLALGMLHKLGMLLLLAIDEDAYIPILAQHSWNSPRLPETERHMLGHDHIALGASCLQQWNLPERTCLAVKHQLDPLHLPSHSEARTLASMLWLASHLAESDAAGTPPEQVAQQLCGQVIVRQLQLSPDAVTSIAQRLAQDQEPLLGE